MCCWRKLATQSVAVLECHNAGIQTGADAEMTRSTNCNRHWMCLKLAKKQHGWH